jgi:hypothetical protein
MLSETNETIEASFFALASLPENLHPVYRETLEDLQRHDGRMIVKWITSREIPRPGHRQGDVLGWWVSYHLSHPTRQNTAFK